MSEDYTPSMDRLRSAYVADRFKGWRGIKTPEQKQETNAEFARAIAVHDAELREQIAREIEAAGENSEVGAYGSYGPPAIAVSDAARIARGQEQD